MFNCEIYAAIMLTFMIGYVCAWYKYNLPPQHVVVRKSPQLPPLSTPIAVSGPGSERFHTGGDDGPLDTVENQDHDDQIIGRIRK